MKIQRINLFAGPGSGKSTLAARIFAELKMRQYSVEHVTEYIKTWSYEKKFPKSFDQVYVFGKQINREDVFLRHVPLIVTDSPMMMNVCYAKYYQCPFWTHLMSIAKLFEAQHTSINFYLPRRTDFKTEGRYHDLEQAKSLDTAIKNIMLEELDQSLCYYDAPDFESIMAIIETRVGATS